MIKTKVCRICSVELNEENWYASQRKRNIHICKGCNNAQSLLHQKAYPEKKRARDERARRKKGERSFSKNKDCSAFLGVHIAERVLSKVFKNVERMPYGNPGYDLICNRGKRIDVKACCIRRRERRADHWRFKIRKNQTADFFLCIAFDNREDLTPLHAWLLPGSKVSHLGATSISINATSKWDKYHLDISKISNCCDAIR